ncbi:MAG: hypothetical protein FJX22_00995 [Alphaproteobacteria bacterium]|nr:hypothetical protein [Alphaproteobacteria bacterium]
MTGKKLTNASQPDSAETITKPTKPSPKTRPTKQADGVGIVTSRAIRAKSRNQLAKDLTTLLLAVAKGEPMVAGDKAGEVAAIYPTLEQRLKAITMLLKQSEQAAATLAKTQEETANGGKKFRATRAYSADELRQLLANHLAELSGEKPASKAVGKTKRS